MKDLDTTSSGMSSEDEKADANLLTTQEISEDIKNAITGLTDLKNNAKARIWTNLKYNGTFVLSSSHHHLRTIKRKKNILREKIKNGSLISGNTIPSQLDIDGKKRVDIVNNHIKSEPDYQQSFIKRMRGQPMQANQIPSITNQQGVNLTPEQISKLNFMHQKRMFIQSNQMRKKPSTRSRVKLITCLRLLKLANTQIKQKIESLQTKVSVKAVAANNNSELITIIRKVYTLLAKHVGVYLPEKSRLTIRKSLLDLPEKVLENRVESEKQKPTDLSSESDTVASDDVSTLVKNSKLIFLANETLDMLSKVIVILDEKLNKAENWVTQNQEEVFVDALEYQPEADSKLVE
ncbi:hypothetical protein FOG48_02772 [Hanseniaspora uvarum]|nr:hypothetical protein FOG48_02772 [Hanseniaspora uvarum]